MNLETRLQVKPIQKKRQDRDEQIPDQSQTMNRRSRKSAEEDYDEIQKKARENPQEPRCLRSCSRNYESHDSAENDFVAPRRLARNKSIKQMFTDMW